MSFRDEPVTSPELLAEVAALAVCAGRAAPLRLEPLAGGKNNRVFRVCLPGGESLLLKSYFTDPRDSRDRLGAEWAFLRYVWDRGVRTIPEPLACDAERRLGLYSFLPGRRLRPEELTPHHVAAAAEFVLATNRLPRSSSALFPGSEACFSIAQHIATVERRVIRLTILEPDIPLRADAERLVADRLLPAWHKVRSMIITAAGAHYETVLGGSEIIVSPSDFGFHNALVAEGRIAFVDFEYAGWDDPAKLICDFFCQPDVPVPIDLFDAFATRVVEGIGSAAWHLERSRLLLDLYRVKWTCIILNQFLPLGAARRSFASAAASHDLCAQQLVRAERMLDGLSAS